MTATPQAWLDMSVVLAGLNNKRFMKRGISGQIYKLDIEQRPVAIKVFKNIDDLRAVVNNARAIMASCDRKCGHIVEFLGQNESYKFAVFELALCSLHDLLYGVVSNKIVNYSIGNALSWSSQLANGIAYLHGLTPIYRPTTQFELEAPRMMHRNISPSNALLFDNYLVVKISDFVLAGTDKRTDIKFKIEVSRYMAPEVMQESAYTAKSDVFSFGAVFWEIIYRKEFELNTYRHEQSELDSKNLRYVYDSCLNDNSDDRPDMAVVDEVLRRFSRMTERLADYDLIQQPDNGDHNPPNCSQVDKLCNDVEIQSLTTFPLNRTISFKQNLDLSNLLATFDEADGKLIGQGLIGRVYKVRDSEVAIVVCSRIHEELFRRELRILDDAPTVTHQNMVLFYGHGVLHGGQTAIALEYANCSLQELLHGEREPNQLHDAVVQYSIMNALTWCSQIIDALAFLHRLRFLSDNTYQFRAFANLNTSSILMFDNWLTAKLTDTRISILKQTVSPTQRVTTPTRNSAATLAYASSRPTAEQHRVIAALHDCGAIFWEIIHRKPFAARSDVRCEDQAGSVLKNLYNICRHSDNNHHPQLHKINRLITLIIKRCSEQASYLFYFKPQLKSDLETRPPPYDIKTLENLWETWEKHHLSRLLVTDTIIDVDDVVNYLGSPNKKLVGDGSYGKVYKMDYDGQPVAVKVISGTPFDHAESFHKEFTSFRIIAEQQRRHNHIVLFLGSGRIGQDWFIVLEYALCSLHSLLHSTVQDSVMQYSIGNALTWCAHIADAVAYLHTLSIPDADGHFSPMIHRDLKSENVLLFDNYNVAKITDFGLARIVAQKMTTARGTIRSMAVEVFNGQNYTTKCDVYSAGTVFWEIFNRKMFSREDSSKRPKHELLKNILKSCLNDDPENRLEMKTVYAQIKALSIESLMPTQLTNTPFEEDPLVKVWDEWIHLSDQSIPLRSRMSSQNNIVIFDKTMCVLRCDQMQWQNNVFPLPRMRKEGAAALLWDERIMLTGGKEPFADGGFLMVTEILEIVQPWREIRFSTAPGPRRVGCDAVPVDNGSRVVIAGGADRERCLRSSELYVAPQNRNVLLPDMNDARSALAMAVDMARQSSRVIATGGLPLTNRAEQFDMVNMRWFYTASMVERRESHAAASLDGRFYVTGGRWNENSVESTDLRECRWQITTPMRHQRRYHRLLAFGGQLFAIGGSPDAASVEVFDNRNHSWRDGPNMNATRWSFQAVIV